VRDRDRDAASGNATRLPWRLRGSGVVRWTAVVSNKLHRSNLIPNCNSTRLKITPRRSVYAAPRRAAPPATRVLEGFVRYDGAEPRLAISVPVAAALVAPPLGAAVVVAPSSASSRASLIVARAPRCDDGPTALLLLLLLRWEASCELFPTEGAGELELRWLGAAGGGGACAGSLRRSRGALLLVLLLLPCGSSSAAPSPDGAATAASAAGAVRTVAVAKTAALVVTRLPTTVVDMPLPFLWDPRRGFITTLLLVLRSVETPLGESWLRGVLP